MHAPKTTVVGSRQYYLKRLVQKQPKTMIFGDFSKYWEISGVFFSQLHCFLGQMHIADLGFLVSWETCHEISQGESGRTSSLLKE